MEPSLTLTTLLPALRAITSITAGSDERTWQVTINRERFQNVKITQKGLTKLFEGLGIEIINEERDRITLRLPEAGSLEDYIQSHYDELLKLYKPRLLRPDEIERLVNALPRVYSPVEDIAEHARQQIMARIREQLAEIVITPLGKADLMEALIFRFEKARVEPGETVGLTVAEALSSLTQAALNAIHQSGQRSNVSAGIEMLQDLLAARQERKTEQCNVHFWNKDLTFEEIFKKRAEIVEITVGGDKDRRIQGIILDFTIDSPDNFGTYWWVTLYPQLSGRPLPKTSTIVRLDLNKTRMVAYNITVKDIVDAIENFNVPDVITVVPGPADEGVIFVYPNEELVVDPLRRKKINITGNVARTFISEIFLPTLGKIPIKGISGIRGLTPVSTTTWSAVEEEVKLASPETLAKEVNLETKVRLRRSWILHLSRFVMGREGIIPEKLVSLLVALGYEIIDRGENYITVIAPNDENPSAYVTRQVAVADQIIDKRRKDRLIAQRDRRKARQTGEELPRLPEEIVDNQTRVSRAGRYYYTQTQGSNLTALFARPDVDTRRTTSNNPHTILHFIGVEAARNLLISEFIYILEISGLELDPRHIILLADFMTNRGMLLPISFWGIVRSDPGPLTVASMGKAVNVFRTAAAFGQSERIQTTASAMYVGQRAQFGSGYVDLRIDEERIKAFEKEMLQREAEGAAEINANDLAMAIDQLDTVTFGATAERSAIDPLADLASLTVETPLPTPIPITRPPPRQPPLELAKTQPIISPLAQKALEGIQTTTPMATPETVITTQQEPPATKQSLPPRRTIPRPGPTTIRRVTPVAPKARLT